MEFSSSHTLIPLFWAQNYSCYTQLLYLHLRDGEGGLNLYAKSTQKL